MKPPTLKDDCFALPPGVNWTPVDEALELLKARLNCVVGTETLPVGDVAARVAARQVLAKRGNPPTANSAVDGYGFAFDAIGDGQQTLPLIAGRSAAGAPFDGAVPPGSAIRILTGAQLPDGVDSVVMQEDVRVGDGAITFQAGLKRRANARDAGEDVKAGAVLFKAGHRFSPPDQALLAATGLGEVEVYQHLKVGVLSTGDELRQAGVPARADQIYDANRPMLLALLARWGFEAVDLGHAADDRDDLRDCLNHAAASVDAILTSGGASAGEEDHMSAILAAEGQIQSWRIALKPGRPLALGLWQGVPIFGLPGNPVAAFICALIFARPALGQLGGADWAKPQGFMVPAAFAKAKKAGRREYLRARIMPDGRVEAFRSEGSGLISGMSWADGLVELGDEAQEVKPGDLVRFLPYGSFGI
ncbi:MAG: molybdopterin molybdenumtransferase MoeA [Alphaproteobacteria bacterium]|nr:molybdopterin molybdenumtransferase MoeA [Alphaproteobacteria bacterium]